MNTNPNLKQLTENLDKILIEYNYTFIKMLLEDNRSIDELEDELKLIRAYISNSERNHREN